MPTKSMSFILQSTSFHSYSKIAKRFAAYKKYLESIRNRLPENVFEYATASWHYNRNDLRCPHDARLLRMQFEENVEDENFSIIILLKGAYSRAQLQYRYNNVAHYKLGESNKLKPPVESYHGDFLMDEIALSKSGRVIHEILFSKGSKFFIECSTFEYKYVAEAA